MLFSVPIFSDATYVQDPDPYTVGLEIMSEYPVNSDDFNDALDSMWFQMRKLRTPVISIYFEGLNEAGEIDSAERTANSPNPEDLRSNEKELVSIGEGDTFAIAIYDLRPNTSLQAGLGIGTTIFVCIVLASGAMLFS